MVSFCEYLHLQKKNIVDMSELQLGLAFDQHNHVIENGRCNLCDILISSSRTKHCSVCNKERTTFRVGFQKQILIIPGCMELFRKQPQQETEASLYLLKYYSRLSPGSYVTVMGLGGEVTCDL
jgi:hypothetical protein